MKQAVLIFFVLVSLVFNVNLAYAQDNSVKIALVPDIHLSFSQKDDWILLKESSVIFQSVINDLNIRTDVDYTFFGGDLINNDDKKMSDIVYFTDVLNDFKRTFFVILGDREADTEEDYDKFDFTSEFRNNGFLNYKQTYYQQDLKCGYTLIGLDTTIKNKFEGELDKQQLDWLKEQLELSKDKKVIILMHHPAVVASDIPFKKDFLLKNSTEFVDLIKNHPNVKLVLSGHLHLNSVTRLDKTYYITAPSVSTFPNTYKILTINNDSFYIETQKIRLPDFVKKSKKLLPTTEYANTIVNEPKSIIKFFAGNKESNKKVYLFD
jgi:3',5'-cyclic AMP phosphodiesterase CpdA